MNPGRAAATPVRPAWLAALVVPLVLLVGPPAEAWHEEHHDDHGCVLCTLGREAAELPETGERAVLAAPDLAESVADVRRVPARRPVLLPARAPPA